MATESAKCATNAAVYEAVVYLTKDISLKGHVAISGRDKFEKFQ